MLTEVPFLHFLSKHLSGALLPHCVVSPGLQSLSPPFRAGPFRSVPEYLVHPIFLYILEHRKHTLKQTEAKLSLIAIVHLARQKSPWWIPEVRQMGMHLQLSSLQPAEDHSSGMVITDTGCPTV